MNMIDVQDKLKGFSEDQLVKEMQAPTGIAPQFLVLSEMTRRKRMRDSMQPQDTGSTVAEEVVSASGVPQGGLATMAQALAPQSSIAQNTAAPVQGMYGGGYVQKMADGGIASLMASPAARAYAEKEAQRLNMTLEQYLQTAMPPQTNQMLTQFAQRQSDRNRMLGLEPVGEGVTFPTQMDLDRRFSEGNVAIDSRPMVAPVAEDRPFLPMQDARIIGYKDPAMTMPQMPSLPQPDAAPQVDLDLTLEEAGSVPTDAQALLEEVWRGTAPGAGLGGPQNISQTQRAEPREIPPPLPPQEPAPEMYPTDLSWIGDMAGGAWDSVTGALSGFSNVPESFKTPPGRVDRDQQGMTAPPVDRGTEETPSEEAVGADTIAGGGGDGVVADLIGRGGAGPSGNAMGVGTGGGAGTPTSYEQELMNAMERAGKRAEQDKWLSLAQVGLNLMASKQPTLGGAIGEAGLGGLEAYRGSRDAYEQERLGLSKAMYDIQASRAAALAAQRSAGAKAAGGPSLSDLDSAIKMLTTEVKGYDDAGNEMTRRVPLNDADAALIAQLEAEKAARIRGTFAPTM